MAKSEARFKSNQLVKIKGRAAPSKVSYSMAIPIPTITDGQFVLIERTMYKFIKNNETFYAWEEDVRA
jgi:hypothetical protein